MRLLSLLLIAYSGCSAAAAAPPKQSDAGAPLDSNALPADLTRTFSQLAAAIKKGETADIERLSLPHAVTITSQPRQSNDENGQDINLSFAKTKFSGAIQHVRHDGTCCWLIRTNTSAFHFVRLEHRWYLYRYLDKPIE